MQLSDRFTGAGIALLGAIVFAAARQLPPMPGQQIGPSVFPSVIGLALALCGVLIAFGIGKSFEALDADEPMGAVGESPVEAGKPAPGWTVLVPVALLLFYVAAVGTVGFVLVASVMVLVMALTLGARLKVALLLALLAPPFVHLIFAKLLRVPLAAGWLPMPW